MLAAALIAALVSVTIGISWLGAAVVARHEAQGAADLAALAAAGALPTGRDAACDAADDLAAANRAEVTRCQVDGLDVLIEARIMVRLGRFGLGPAQAVARAGPALPS